MQLHSVDMARVFHRKLEGLLDGNGKRTGTTRSQQKHSSRPTFNFKMSSTFEVVAIEDEKLAASAGEPYGFTGGRNIQ